MIGRNVQSIQVKPEGPTHDRNKLGLDLSEHAVERIIEIAGECRQKLSPEEREKQVFIESRSHRLSRSPGEYRRKRCVGSFESGEPSGDISVACSVGSTCCGCGCSEQEVVGNETCQGLGACLSSSLSRALVVRYLASTPQSSVHEIDVVGIDDGL
ncbi:hypothetical protein PIIN_02026 [Serendipita indica DSM 11827]|uniref:Uncharacterized protein n=1 Tax=Serendipita indica (strain DSM 11827) TaxID=1109443 RepID=G4TA16_SERID|nr:hypothetical protein PIIN_02026 [Serendipita indica DSM 11827]